MFALKYTHPSNARIVFWNAVGSLISSLSSFLFLFLITRKLGSEVAGDYSLGLGIAQLMWTIGVFDATTYFATDAKDRFTSEQYLGFKLLCCTAMVVVSICYTLSFGFSVHKTLLVLALCLFNLIDALNLFYFAAFQKAGRLDVAGFSVFVQTTLAFVFFTVALFYFNDVLWAVVGACAGKGMWVLFYNLSRLSVIAPVHSIDISLTAMKALFFELLPLFGATFLANYLANIPKYAIDQVATSQIQGIFSIIFMPSFVINLFVLFVMRPVLTPMAQMYAQKEIGRFIQTTLKILALVCGLTLFVLIGSYTVGIPVLEWVFGVNLDGVLPSLMVVMLGGGLSSVSNVLYNDIIILRKQRSVLIAYTVAVAGAFVIASPLTQAFGLLGASLTYLLSAILLIVVYVLVCVKTLVESKKNSKPSTN